MEKNNRSYMRTVRYAVQWTVFCLILFAGYKFYLFVEQFLTADAGPSPLLHVKRPPSVDGFLPIGALMAFKLWITTGMFDHIHPSGLIIFIAAIATALMMKKGFCGWICPVGTLSEPVWKLGTVLYGKNFRMNRYIDYALRSLKYILMMFFLYVIVIQMPPFAILLFLEGDYYKIADVKMLYFFTRMTQATLITLIVLFVLSTLYKNFWCRYLCPYGALLGLLSLCSPLKITRDENACINCGSCTKNCPSLLPVSRKQRIRSPECTGCLTCVSRCPAKGALDMAVSRKQKVHPVIFAFLLMVLFFGIIVTGKLSGKWESSVTSSEYMRIIPQASMLDHP